jgi:HAD superfamily hydrolase (TIGR01549 family)
MLMREFCAAQSQEIDAIRLHPGLDQVLGSLTRQGVRMGVLTSNSKDNVVRFLRANGAQDHFDFIEGYSQYFGKATSLKRIVHARGLTIKEAIYIGDEVRDIEAGRKAGMDVLAVAWGVHLPALLTECLPSHLVSEPGQILTCLTCPSE